MPFYKSPDNKPYFLSEEDVAKGWASRLPPGSVQVSDEEANPPKTKVKLKAEELSALAIWRQEGMDYLTKSWLNASVTDGAIETERKAAIQEDITALKEQYAADKAAIIAKYA